MQIRANVLDISMSILDNQTLDYQRINMTVNIMYASQEDRKSQHVFMQYDMICACMCSPLYIDLMSHIHVDVINIQYCIIQSAGTVCTAAYRHTLAIPT